MAHPRGAPKTPGSGRKKGSRNKRTLALEAEIAASGEIPLDYMLRIMRDPNADDRRRDEMAIAAAPYVHPRLAAVTHAGEDGGHVRIERIERVIVDPPTRSAVI
jgi:hypothetical protein